MTNNSLYNGDLLSGDYHPKVVAYYFKEWNGYNMDFHAHNQVEIMYAIKGKCVVETEKSSHTMKNGDFILLDANVKHNLIVGKDQPCRMLNIEFAFVEKSKSTKLRFHPTIKELAQDSQSVNSVLKMQLPYFLLKDTDEIYHILKALVMELDEAGEDAELMAGNLLSQLFIKVSRQIAVQKNNEAAGGIYVRKALQFIHQNYDCDISVEEIAGAINVHPGYFHRIFKAHTGITIVEYLTSLRIDKAKMLLEQTEIPIIDITNYIGMNSRQYFSYVFKKKTGLTPFEYRKSSLKEKWKRES